MNSRKLFAPEGSGGQLSRQQRRQNARRQAQRNRAAAKLSGQDMNPVGPTFVAQTLAQAVTKLQAGAYDEGVGLVDDVLRIAPRHPEALALKGAAAFQCGQVIPAVELFQKSIAGDDRAVHVHFNLGVALEKLHRHAEAAESFERVTRLNPNYPGCWMGLAIAWTAQWRFHEAMRVAEKALSFPGDRAEIYATLGGACLGVGAAEKALFYYTEALQLKPQAVHLHDTVRIAAALIAFATGADGAEVWVATLAELHKKMPASPVPSILESFVRICRADRPPDALAPIQKSLPADVEQTLQHPEPIPNKQARPSVESHPRMCALLHFGRAATGLLHALLDDHPQVTTLPGVYFKGFFGYGLWDRIRNADGDLMIDRLIDLYEVLFDARHPKPVPGNPMAFDAALGVQEGFAHMGENADQWLSLDKNAFRKIMRGLLAGRESISHGEFFVLLHRAFERVRGKPGDEELIVYHIHNPNHYEFANFLRYFPDTQITMMVREPVQNCESWISGQVLETFDYYAMASRLTTMPLEISQPEFENRDSFGVRLDDLKLRPEATMRALVKRLGIDWNPGLLEPTMQGLKWRGDPSSSTFGLDPFDPGVLKREVGKVFGERDQKILRALYYPFRVLYGWEMADESVFRELLAEAPDLLENPMDCEKRLIEGAAISEEQLAHHGSYRYIRCLFHQRLKTLEKYGTYPGMIPRLGVAN